MTDQTTDATRNADMRIEVVKRELNQGALAGFDSAVTNYAAQLVVAALDTFDATALKAAYERGLAEGRRQATEGWECEWGSAAALGTWPTQPCESEASARTYAARTRGQVAVSRLVGPWEPAEQTEAAPAPNEVRWPICYAAHRGMLCDRQRGHQGDHVDVYGPLPDHTWAEPASGGVVEPSPLTAEEATHESFTERHEQGEGDDRG